MTVRNSMLTVALAVMSGTLHEPGHLLWSGQ